MKSSLFKSLALGVAGSLAFGTAALAVDVKGSGATFPQSFLAAATVAFKATPQGAAHNVNYANPGGGSGAGQTAFKNSTATGGQVDFAGTDSAVTSANTPSFDWVYVPYVAGPIAVGYRLDELGGATLGLTPSTVAGIYDGSITKWNHPSIVNDLKSSPAWSNSKKKSDLKGATALIANNVPGSANVTVTALPNVFKSVKGKTVELIDVKTKKSIKKATFSKAEVTLTFGSKENVKYSVRLNGKELAVFEMIKITMPDKDIIVAYRSDGSGTTNNFCSFLRNTADTNWVANNSFTSCIPGGSSKISALGARFQGQSGSANVMNYVANTNGSIGYAEVSFMNDATRAAKGVKSANIRNAAGRYVGPTSANASSFLGGSTWDLDKGFATFNFKQTSNTTAYPIVAVTYLLAKTAKAESNAVVQAFAKWVLEDFGPNNAEGLGYAPLSGKAKDIGLAQVAKINSK